MVVDQIGMLDGPTPLQSATPMAIIAMTVESECLFVYVKGAAATLFLKLRSGTDGLYKELDRHIGRDGSPECPNCGPIKGSVLHVLFECASYDFHRQKILAYLKQFLSYDASDAFFRNSIFDKALFFLGKRNSLLVNNECSSWYSRVGSF